MIRTTETITFDVAAVPYANYYVILTQMEDRNNGVHWHPIGGTLAYSRTEAIDKFGRRFYTGLKRKGKARTAKILSVEMAT
jgi:hypothetical protein